MFKIGDFSKLAHVTVKTPRHYADLGLLGPAWVERFSGYRYYSLEQLPRLNRILALKDPGFSLDQVRQLLDSQLNGGQLRSMLSQKQSELLQRVQTEQTRLGRVEARLRQIEQEGQTAGLEVALKRVPALQVACARQVIPNIEAVPQWTERLRREIRTWLLQVFVFTP